MIIAKIFKMQKNIIRIIKVADIETRVQIYLRI